jgi:hypothetical protein
LRLYAPLRKQNARVSFPVAAFVARGQERRKAAANLGGIEQLVSNAETLGGTERLLEEAELPVVGEVARCLEAMTRPPVVFIREAPVIASSSRQSSCDRLTSGT